MTFLLHAILLATIVNSHAAIALVGPNKELLVLTRPACAAALRKCVPGSRKEAIERGCPMLAGAPEYEFSTAAINLKIDAELERVYRHGDDRAGIVFNLIHALVPSESYLAPKIRYTSGGVWTLEGNAWRDRQTMRLWLPTDRAEEFHLDAVRVCEHRGVELPSRDDYAEAEKHGLREVFADAFGRPFWTSTMLPGTGLPGDGFRWRYYWSYDGTSGRLFEYSPDDDANRRALFTRCATAPGAVAPPTQPPRTGN